MKLPCGICKHFFISADPCQGIAKASSPRRGEMPYFTVVLEWEGILRTVERNVRLAILKLEMLVSV